MSTSAAAANPSSLRLLGAAVPGLGHLFDGHVVTGVGMLVHLGVLVAAAWTGLPRLSELLFPGALKGGTQVHPWVAVVAWLVALALLYGAAWRHAVQAGRRREVNAKQTQWAIVWRQFIRNRMGLIGLHCVLFLALVTLVTPLLATFDPDMIDVGPKLASPRWGYLFGTDDFSRDLYSRLLYGARISLSIGFVAIGISATFGTVWGAVSGFFGGKVDMLMTWLVDFLLAMPRLILIITIVGLWRPRGAEGIYLIVLILGLTGWMGVSRIVRGMVLSLKEQDFIQASRAIGQSNRLIVLRHLIPNAIAPVIVHATLGIGNTILTEATLSFLGLGVPPPIATWGSIVADGREFLRTAPWVTTIAGLLIVFAVMSFNLLGDGLRDALDPKLRNRS